MADARHLSKAPITEALIDIQVQLPQGDHRDQIQALSKRLESEYPVSHELISFSGEINIHAKDAPTYGHQQDFLGCRNDSTDGLKVVQLRRNGFTFSKLKPYISWKELLDEAWGLWNQYVIALHPEFITRIALRYINKIEIPLPLASLDDYFIEPPRLPKELPNTITQFLSRFGIIDPHTDARGIITQAFEGISDDKLLPIIFDIDVFNEGRKEIDDEHLLELLGKLRNLKNEIFFKSVTDKTLELCE